MNERKVMEKFCKGKPAYTNPNFVSYTKFFQVELDEAENIKKMKGK